MPRPKRTRATDFWPDEKPKEQVGVPCPRCGVRKSEARYAGNGPVGIRRNRVCMGCALRYTTYEHITPPRLVVRADPVADLRAALQTLEDAPVGPQRRNSLEKCKTALMALDFLFSALKEDAWASTTG